MRCRSTVVALLDIVDNIRACGPVWSFSVSYGARDWDPAPAYLLAATLYAALVNSVSERVQAQWIRNNANACAPG